MKQKLYAALIEWHAAADKPLPRWLERACQRDPRLARARQSSRDLTRGLSQDKPTQAPRDPSPFLEARILAALRSEAQPRRAASPAWGWSLAIGSAACLAAYSFFQFGTPPAAQVEAPSFAASQSAAAPSDADESEYSIQAVDLRNPLDREMESLTRDVKGALGFVAASFLPKELYQELEAELDSDEA